jgi:hypothetical protein
MEITTRRRRAFSTALALFLAIESVSAVGAVAVSSRDTGAGSRHELPAAPPAGLVQAARGVPDALAVTGTGGRVARTTSAATTAEGPERPATPARATGATVPARAFAPRAAISSVKGPKPRAGSRGSSAAASTSGGTSSGGTSSGSHRGRNQLWIPGIGLSRSVYYRSCSVSAEPDNHVYRWGCAGRNNIYLLGHAWGVFKPLHDAYIRGRLHAGMKAYYADNSGRTHTYVVKWWKLTRPTTAASWAWASQSVPSMTLQTCVGSNSQYRLMVRLVEVR